MSICSTAVGVLSFIAAVHIVLSIVLVVALAGVCYYGQRKTKQKESPQHSEEREKSIAVENMTGPDTDPLETEKEDIGVYAKQEIVGQKRVSFERTSSGGGEEVVLRKRSRISVASITSNISSRFRKSMDLEPQDDAGLRLMREKSSSSSERESSDRESRQEPTKTDKADSVDPGEVVANKEADNNQVVVKLEMTTADSEC